MKEKYFSKNHLMLIIILFTCIFIFSIPSLALIPGDFGSADNGPPDGVVDFEDLMIFALAYGSTSVDTNWNPDCDIYPDGIIDFEDLMVFALHYGEIGIIIPDTTKITDEETELQLTSVSQDQSEITFVQSTPQLEELQEGDILFIGVTDQTPYGLLRKVTSITRGSRADSEVVVETEFTSIEEAVEELHVSVDIALTQDDIDYEKLRLPPGVSISQDRGGFEYDHTFNLSDVSPIYGGDPSTTIDDVTIDGEIYLNYEMIFNLDIGLFSLGVEFRNIVESYTDLSVTVGGSLSLSDLLDPNPIHLFTIPFVPIPVAPLLVITPVIYINIGLDGEIHAELTVGVTIDQTGDNRLESGFEYNKGQWHSIKNSPVFDLEPKIPVLNLGGTIKPYIGPQLELIFNGCAGVYGSLYGYLELEADINDDPWWCLYGGFEGIIGAQLKILSFDLGDPVEWTIFNPDRKLLRCADGPFGGDVADISGNWSGEYSTNLTSGIMNLIEVEQNGETFNGKYGDTNGAIGNFNGKFINKDSFEFIIEQTNTCGDSGNFQGTGIINNNTISINFSGNNWEGYHKSGIAALSIAVIKSSPVTGVRAESITWFSTTNDILNQVEPSWDSYPDALGYEIYRSVNGGTFKLLYVLEPCNGIIDGINIDTNNEYCYYIIAFGNGWRTVPSQQTNIVNSWLPAVFLQNPENGADINSVLPVFAWAFNYSQIPTDICSVNLIFSIYEDEVSAGAKCYYKTIEDETTSSFQYDGFCLLNGHKYLWNIHAKGYNDNGIWYDNVIADSCSNRYEFTYVGSSVEPLPATIDSQ